MFIDESTDDDCIRKCSQLLARRFDHSSSSSTASRVAGLSRHTVHVQMYVQQVFAPLIEAGFFLSSTSTDLSQQPYDHICTLFISHLCCRIVTDTALLERCGSTFLCVLHSWSGFLSCSSRETQSQAFGCSPLRYCTMFMYAYRRVDYWNILVRDRRYATKCNRYVIRLFECVAIIWHYPTRMRHLTIGKKQSCITVWWSNRVVFTCSQLVDSHDIDRILIDAHYEMHLWLPIMIIIHHWISSSNSICVSHFDV